MPPPARQQPDSFPEMGTACLVPPPPGHLFGQSGSSRTDGLQFDLGELGTRSGSKKKSPRGRHAPKRLERQAAKIAMPVNECAIVHTRDDTADMYDALHRVRSWLKDASRWIRGFIDVPLFQPLPVPRRQGAKKSLTTLPTPGIVIQVFVDAFGFKGVGGSNNLPRRCPAPAASALNRIRRKPRRPTPENGCFKTWLLAGLCRPNAR